jgi:hypothetical protein
MTIAIFGIRVVPQLRQPRRRLSPHALVLRVTGFNAFVGLVYELIGSGKRDVEKLALDEPDRASPAGAGAAPPQTRI